MTDKVKLITEQLYKLYPNDECGLHSNGDPFKLLIMAILSAQCTDKCVNNVSVALFKRFPDAKSIAESEEGELETYIHSVGLYNSKAKSIRACCKTLVNDFGGIIPSEMNDLLKLGGVGRKVANLVRGDVFGLGGIVADTHLIRISNRLGLVDSTNPVIVERTLDPIIPKEIQSGFCHRMVDFGRDTCSAKNPKCSSCPMKELTLCKGEIKKEI